MTYKLTTSGATVIRIEDLAYIPTDPANIDYAAYLKWVAAGNTPDPADVPDFATQKAAYLEQARVTRERILNRLAGIGAAAIVSGDTALQQAFVSARNSLLGITDDPGVVAATDIEGLKTAVLTAYRAMCSSAPATIVSAFNTVDQ